MQGGSVFCLGCSLTISINRHTGALANSGANYYIVQPTQTTITFDGETHSNSQALAEGGSVAIYDSRIGKSLNIVLNNAVGSLSNSYSTISAGTKGGLFYLANTGPLTISV